MKEGKIREKYRKKIELYLKQIEELKVDKNGNTNQRKN